MVVFVNCKETLVLFFDETLLVDTIVGMAAVWDGVKATFMILSGRSFSYASILVRQSGNWICTGAGLVLVPVESA